MTDVVMPQMGESIVEGTLTKWLKKLGEHVDRDEPLFEISTDKVDTEIPSPTAGVLKEVLVEEGKTVAISTVVGRIDEAAGNGASAPAPAKQAPAPAPAAAAQTAPPPPPRTPPPAAAPAPQAKSPELERLKQSVGTSARPVPEQPAAAVEAETSAGPLSPLVRRMAREYGIELRQVKGTGAGGRITKQDLEAYMSAQGARTMAQATALTTTTPAAPTVYAPATPAAPVPAMPRAEAPRSRVEPMSLMRAKIAEHMVLSKRVSAHVTTVHKTDMTKIAKMRERYKAEFQQRYGYPSISAAERLH